MRIVRMWIDPLRLLPMTLFCVLSSLVGSGSALAVPALLVADDRGAGSYGDNCYEDFETGSYSCDHFSYSYEPSAPYADWNGSGQSSSASPTKLEGSGSGSGYSDLGWYQSWSTYRIAFDLDDFTEVHLQGALEVIGDGSASIELLGPSGDPIYSEMIEWGSDSADVLFESILGPGSYVMVAHAQGLAGGGSDVAYQFTLDISPEAAVPEPSTVALLGVGLIGTSLAASRRRRRG